MMRNILFTIVVVSMFGMVSYAMLADEIPVLTFAETKMHSGKFQIVGTPLKDKFAYNEEEQVFSFNLVDSDGVEFNVRYHGVKPGNYDEATEVIVVGKYSAEHNAVIAERLLVKCPSKYEADGVEDYQTMEY